MTDPAGPVTVTNDAADRNYQARIGATVVGTLIYELEGPRVVLTHTIVEPACRGNGIGSTLVRAALDDLRRDGKTITIMCPFVTDFIELHPEYAGLVSADHPGQPFKR